MLVFGCALLDLRVLLGLLGGEVDHLVALTACGQVAVHKVVVVGRGVGGAEDEQLYLFFSLDATQIGVQLEIVQQIGVAALLDVLGTRQHLHLVVGGLEIGFDFVDRDVLEEIAADGRHGDGGQHGDDQNDSDGFFHIHVSFMLITNGLCPPIIIQQIEPAKSTIL